MAKYIFLHCLVAPSLHSGHIWQTKLTPSAFYCTY